MRRALLLILLTALGCDEGRRAPGPGGGGTPADGGGVRQDAGFAAPPMGLAVTITAAFWGGVGGDGLRALTFGVVLANGAGAPPASLAPASFQLETSGGAAVTGRDAFGEGRCTAAIAVAPGAALGCVVEFGLLPGDLPSLLRYTADTRTTSGPIPSCEASRPDGLCGPDDYCERGRCQPLCGGAMCQAGTACLNDFCVTLCSPSAPDGVCPQGGGCRNGSCDPSCRSLNPSAAGCSECIGTLSCMQLGGCSDAGDCVSCVVQRDECSCSATSACAGCESSVASLFGCIQAGCPMCVR
jgi:hypothetical protein